MKFNPDTVITLLTYPDAGTKARMLGDALILNDMVKMYNRFKNMSNLTNPDELVGKTRTIIVFETMVQLNTCVYATEHEKLDVMKLRPCTEMMLPG